TGTGSRPATARMIAATTNLTTSRGATEAVQPRRGNRGASGPDRNRRARGDGRTGPQTAHRWRLRNATTREFPRWRRSSTARGLGRCAEPGRNSGADHATFARGRARHTAEDRPAAARPRQIAGRGKRRIEEIVATFA